MKKSGNNLYKLLQTSMKKELKHYKRQTLLLKIKLILLVVLPAVTAVVTAKAAQIWISLKLQEIKLPESRPVIQPVHQETVKLEFITPKSLHPEK